MYGQQPGMQPGMRPGMGQQPGMMQARDDAIKRILD